MKCILRFAALFALHLIASGDVLSASPDVWQAVRFLQGSWEARTQAGAANATGAGTYTFNFELKHHVLARHSTLAACQGPEEFDCKHSDLLYVYAESEGKALQAIYFDNEGHVIHYAVSSPEPATVNFVSEASAAGPQFQLIYQLKAGVMSGKFQMRMPGNTEWQSYLEWSGSRK